KKLANFYEQSSYTPVMLYATNGLRTGSSLQDLGFRGYLQYFSLLCNPALEGSTDKQTITEALWVSANFRWQVQNADHRSDHKCRLEYMLSCYACGSLVNYLTTKLMDCLTAKLVDHLTTKLVDCLTPKLMDRLTTKLMSRLTTKLVNRLTAKIVDSLTAKLIVVINLVKLDLTKSKLKKGKKYLGQENVITLGGLSLDTSGVAPIFDRQFIQSIVDQSLAAASETLVKSVNARLGMKPILGDDFNFGSHSLRSGAATVAMANGLAGYAIDKIPVVLENRRSSQGGGGCAPPAPSP
ncbi:unnamed protein product, partial [Porites lobata]